MRVQTMNWQAIDADPRFQRLHREKSRFLATLMAVSIVYYLLLPLGAAWYPEIFRIRLWGPVNVGLVCGLSEFLMAWGVAMLYAQRANRRFDAMAAELLRDAAGIGGRA
jgi:uncharacterized membrane protein (DUF485 family)